MVYVFPTKAEHDQNHKVLGATPLEDCVWCEWEFEDMEDRTRGV